MVRELTVLVTERIYQLMLVLGCLSMVLAVLLMYMLLGERRQQVEKVNQQKHTVRDFYTYHEQVDPPDMNT
jgi:CHASE3 domain sensor protein